jgi:hypothetical protein
VRIGKTPKKLAMFNLKEEGERNSCEEFKVINICFVLLMVKWVFHEAYLRRKIKEESWVKGEKQ